jgi:hypothetical protein
MNRLISSVAPCWMPALVASLLLWPAAAPARADFQVSVQSVAVDPSSTGNALEVTLTNTGPSAATVGSFSFGLTTDSPTLITFTGATTDTTTAPYIFAGHSLFGPVISLGTGATLTASDVYDVSGAGVSLGAGATVGLGRVLFDAGNTAILIPMTLAAFPDTSLSDATGTDIPITRLNGGVIKVGSPVPEPSSLALLGVGVAGLAAAAVRSRTRDRTAAGP